MDRTKTYAKEELEEGLPDWVEQLFKEIEWCPKWHSSSGERQKKIQKMNKPAAPDLLVIRVKNNIICPSPATSTF